MRAGPRLLAAASALVLGLTSCGAGATVGLPVGNPEDGEAIYARNCASCHGELGSGTDQGPPLVDEIYRPGHHGDASFLAAVRSGVRPHHWNFGPMPPVEGLSDDEVADVVAYVRQLQEEAGIR